MTVQETLPAKIKLVSLLSNWYSGATLLTILLDAHSQVVSNGESLPFGSEDNNRYDCSCGKYLDECEFYDAVAKHMKEDGTGVWDKELFVQVPQLSTKPIVRSFLNSPRYESWIRNYLIEFVPAYRLVKERFLRAQIQFFSNALNLTGATVYMDGTKSIRRAQLFARDPRCTMKAIHLIRDGRAFCYSYLKHTSLKEENIGKPIKRWLYYIRQVDNFVRVFPHVSILTVRYEDLCRATTKVLESVCEFLEIPYEHPTIVSTRNMHILGNRMRRTFDGKIVEDVSWRNELTAISQAKINSLASRELQRFGYS